MTLQIIILNTSSQPDGSFSVSGVFWLVAPSNNIIPMPNFQSQVPFIDPTNLSLLQSGQLVEQSFNSGLFASGTILGDAQTAIQAQYSTAQTTLTNTNSPLGGLIGSVYTGSVWTGTNPFVALNNTNPSAKAQLTQVVLSNATVTVSGSQIFTGYSNRQVNLFINVTAAPTGSSPGLQFTIQELDPGDLTTAIGTSITGLSITSGPQTQEVTLNLTTSSVIKVSWIIVGTGSPTFTGVYATLVSKPTTVFSGVDAGGVERVFQPDTGGRLLVSGSNAINTAVTVNPIITGGVNPAGVAGYNQLSSDDSLVVSQGINKQPVFINATVTTSGISNIVGLGVPMVNLFINIKNMPTGTSPAITFSMYEIDPGDLSTPIGTSVIGVPLTAVGTQILTLPLTTSGTAQVSWTIAGASPSFTGVYVTAMMKDANMITGPTSVGSKLLGNPIINGAVDTSGNVQALSSKLVNGLMNMTVTDEQTVNKLDQIILLLTDIRDRENLGE